MGYYVGNTFGIRTGGLLSGKIDMDDMKKRIAKIVMDAKDTEYAYDLGGEDGDISHCMSQELEAHKGSMVVIGGIFNYWKFDMSSKFAAALSKEFGTEVMHMCWDMERDTVQCQVWLGGTPLYEVSENPIGKILRHVI